MYFLVILLLFSFLFIPSFEIKIISVLTLLLLVLKKNRSLHKRDMFLFLFAIYAFAFIYSPYWLTFVTIPWLKYITLGLLYVFGLFWANDASREVKFPRVKLDLVYLASLAGILYAINYIPMRADIPWRGDEQYHISWLIDLFSYFQFFWNNRAQYQIESMLLGAIILIIFLVLVGRKYFSRIFKRRGTILLVLSLVPLSAALLYSPRIFADQKEILLLSDVLRYPYFSKWLQLPFIFPNTFADVRLYRSIPFLSQILTSWYLFYLLVQNLKSKLLAFLYSLAIVTIPVFLFYSSLLYLEMPLVLCLLICTVNLRKLITFEEERLKSELVWYILLFSAFIKEVALVFLVLLIILRASYQFYWISKFEKRWIEWGKEIRLYFLVLSPVLIYFAFRMLFVRTHIPMFTFRNGLVFGNYTEIVRTNFYQVGTLFIIGIVGFLFLLLKKHRFTFWTHSLLFLGFTFFFLGYYSQAYFAFGNEDVFVGYSRWNLITVSVLISVSLQFLSSIKNSCRIFILLALLAANILYYPFASDGVRLPNWGSMRADAAEYSYPYEAAIAWLSQTRDTKKLLWFGHYSEYLGMRFYFEKYAFWPEVLEKQISRKRFNEEEERILFTSFMREVETDETYQDVDTILYHSVNNIYISGANENLGRFTNIKRIQNSQHSLYIFKKQSGNNLPSPNHSL